MNCGRHSSFTKEQPWAKAPRISLKRDQTLHMFLKENYPPHTFLPVSWCPGRARVPEAGCGAHSSTHSQPPPPHSLVTYGRGAADNTDTTAAAEAAAHPASSHACRPAPPPLPSPTPASVAPASRACKDGRSCCGLGASAQVPVEHPCKMPLSQTIHRSIDTLFQMPFHASLLVARRHFR